MMFSLKAQGDEIRSIVHLISLALSFILFATVDIIRGFYCYVLKYFLRLFLVYFTRSAINAVVFLDQ